MLLNPESAKPIYVQIAEWLEGEILSGNIREDERIYSQYQLAEMFNVNPATAAKGLNLLADNNIVYKKRGLGMFVSPQAREIVRKKRQNTVLKQLVFDLVCEAERLGVSADSLAEMIQEARDQLKGEN
ncbi:MAG TPA: GntR family transcriptional regulator [Peptococcaceae bacterium]|nr:GntR family transcriptional regulator [Peptococcaceae bacterium]